MPVGLAPEHVTVHADGSMRSGGGWADHNFERPETVETLFYMWRTTKDKKYRDWAWELFQKFEEKTKVSHGYAGLADVNQASGSQKDNRMQSFWLGETLKYFWLIFSDDDALALDKYAATLPCNMLCCLIFMLR